jgi:hypothetical protein
MSDKREKVTIMMKPSVKTRLFVWAAARGCKPCDLLEELVFEGLADVATAKAEVAA